MSGRLRSTIFSARYLRSPLPSPSPWARSAGRPAISVRTCPLWNATPTCSSRNRPPQASWFPPVTSTSIPASTRSARAARTRKCSPGITSPYSNQKSKRSPGRIRRLPSAPTCSRNRRKARSVPSGTAPRWTSDVMKTGFMGREPTATPAGRQSTGSRPWRSIRASGMFSVLWQPESESRRSGTTAGTSPCTSRRPSRAAGTRARSWTWSGSGRPG